MFSVRLPANLVDRVVEMAAEEDVSRAELAEEALEELLEQRTASGAA